MSNQLPLPDPLLVLSRAPDAEPLRQQLYRQLREAILNGHLAPGRALPSSRPWAQRLGLGRSTLVEALEQLKVEGYLEARQGAATRVAAHLPARGFASQRLPALPEPLPDRVLAHWQEDDPPTPVTARCFRPGLPDLAALPAREWAACLSSRARQPRLHDLSYVGGTGLAVLQAQIVQHVASTRFVRAQPDQVLVLPSARAAFDVALRCALPEPGTVWVEDPGYPGIQSLLRAHRAEVCPVPVDAQGLDFEDVAQDPAVVYVTPSHQYPTGVALSLHRRMALIERVRRCAAVIIEDDYDSEFQYRGLPIASLQGLDPHDNVFYVGTFSKTLAPGLHVAYLVVPRRFVGLAHTVASTVGLSVAVHIQLALADFMQLGCLRRHIRRMNGVYADRMRRLVQALRDERLAGMQVPDPAGGLQLLLSWASAPSDQQIARALAEVGIHANPLSRLSLRARGQGLLLGIGLCEAAEIPGAVQRLAQVWHQARAAQA
jgi:GntR family transcriptional regulator/MocR family aminotransferase